MFMNSDNFNKVITTMVIRPLDDRSLIWGFGESCTIVHNIVIPMCSQMRPVYIFVDLQPFVWLQFERETFHPPVWG